MRKYFINCFLLLFLFSFVFQLPIYAQTEQSTSVSVPPRDEDLPISISSDNAGVNMPQNTTITYTITYGLNTSVSFPLTITAFWSQGTIQGNPSPSVDIVDYVVGSASNGYNSTQPTVDLVNSKITWVYTSFPAQTTGQTVTFKLKTNSSYTGVLPVSFDISSNSKSSTTTTSDQTLTQTYKYASVPTPTPTQTPTPTAASTTSISTTTPTPTPTPSATLIPSPSFSSVEIRSITPNSADIFVSTTTKTKLTVSYGNSLGLNNTLSFSDYSLSRLINLKDLLPNTQYFFKLIAQDSSGKRISSDTFTFKTALLPSSVFVDLKSIIVVSGNNVIFDSVSNNSTSSAQGVILMPQNTTFQFKFSISQAKSVNRIRLILRRITGKTVLGESNLNFSAYANAASVSLVEIQPGVYSVALNSNIEAGTYQLLTSYVDEKGNLNEQELALLKITNPFTVYDNNSNPLEGARIFLYLDNKTGKGLIPLSPSFLNGENPVFTNSKGVVDLVLPQGNYRATVSLIGYVDKKVHFNILESDKSGYPIVKLEKTPINLFSILRYYWRSFNEVFLEHTFTYFASLQNSIRFFDFIAANTMLLFVIITFYAFLRKNNIEHLPSYFIYLFHHLINSPNKDKYIKGLIREKEGAPISGVHIYLIDDESQEVIETALTNRNGEFFFKKGGSTYYLVAMKKGYFSTSQIEARENGFIEYDMEKKTYKEMVIIKYWRKLFNGVFSISFEMLIFSSFFFQLIFINYFGVEKTIPFLIISLFNIIVWVMHLRHTRHHPTKID